MADDDPEDCMLARMALQDAGSDASFSCVEDGRKLMDHLAERYSPEVEGLPDLILLDLNMPKLDGRQALVKIKSDPELRHIPIVILSTSGDQNDIESMLKAGAESFLTKPMLMDGWVSMMKSLAEKWLRDGTP
jgi:CheY-like chemotaxis protein